MQERAPPISWRSCSLNDVALNNRLGPTIWQGQSHKRNPLVTSHALGQRKRRRGQMLRRADAAMCRAQRNAAVTDTTSSMSSCTSPPKPGRGVFQRLETVCATTGSRSSFSR